MKDKLTDHIREVAKQQKRTNRLNSIKNGLEAGTIKDWEQIFAILSETSLSFEMGISFYSFRKKLKNCGHFTIFEIMGFAALFGVKYDVMSTFIIDKIKSKNKSKIF